MIAPWGSGGAAGTQPVQIEEGAGPDSGQEIRLEVIEILRQLFAGGKRISHPRLEHVSPRLSYGFAVFSVGFPRETPFP